MPTFFDVMFTNIVVDERQTGLAYLYHHFLVKNQAVNMSDPYDPCPVTKLHFKLKGSKKEFVKCYYFAIVIKQYILQKQSIRVDFPFQ